MSNDPSFNLAQLEQRPNWYEHLSSVENAMAAEDKLYRTRWQAGWSCDEGGWFAPDGTSEYDWSLEGYPFPEDPEYQAWASAFWHYDALDAAPIDPRNDDDYDTWAYGTEPLPGDHAWLHDDHPSSSVSAESGTHPE